MSGVGGRGWRGRGRWGGRGVPCKQGGPRSDRRQLCLLAPVEDGM